MNFLFNTARCSESSTKSDNSFIRNSAIPVEVREMLANETGKDRVKRIFSDNEFGFSPELRYVCQSGSIMLVMAGIYGAVTEMNKAKENFLRKNMGSAFESQHLARRSLMDTMSLAAITGGIRYGVKLGTFTSVYLLGTMTVANYRNKITVWEHIGVAALLGGVSRLNYGVKGFLVAGGLGGFLGLIAGGVICLSMRFTGFTLEELRYYQHEDYFARNLRRKKKEEAEKTDQKDK